MIRIPLVQQVGTAARVCVTTSVPRAWSAAETGLFREAGPDVGSRPAHPRRRGHQRERGALPPVRQRVLGGAPGPGRGDLRLELQHRVSNIMAMIRSVADRDRLDGRLSAMARVQTLLTREANADVEPATLVEAQLSARAGHAGQYGMAGTRLQLAPKAAEVLTLAIQELATNPLKYGAFPTWPAVSR